MPLNFKRDFEEPLRQLQAEPKFYSTTWHDTRENALKCPPCKEVVLAEERQVEMENAHDAALTLNRKMDEQRELDAYTLVRQGLKVIVPPTGRIKVPQTGSHLYEGKPGTIVHVCPRRGWSVTPLTDCKCDEPPPNPVQWQRDNQHFYKPSHSKRCDYRYPVGLGCGHPEKHELHVEIIR